MQQEAEESLLVGSILSGRYGIISLLGKGGIGVVYKARHMLMDRTVAIKMLKRIFAADSTSLLRFQQEAKTASSLTHQNVIGVHDFGITDDGLPFLVMDFLQGTSLGDIIRDEGHIEPARVISIFSQSCAGIHHAHLQGVIHRDVKPSNIMLVRGDDGSDLVKIVDFGMAKLMAYEGVEALRLTATGDVLGSPLYMSPEQCTAEPLDARSDVYSMGCSMYEALTGRPPLMGHQSMDTMYKHLNEIPLTFDRVRKDLKIPSRLEAIVFRALEKDPRKRYQTMLELKDALDAANLEQNSSLRNIITRTSLKIRRDIHRKQPVTMALVAFLLVLVVAPLVLLVTSTSQEQIQQNDLKQLLSQEKTTAAKFEALSVQLDGTDDEQVYEKMSDLLGKQAAVYLDQSKYKEAETVFKEAEALSRKALKLRENKFGSDHPIIANGKRNLADLLGNHSEILRKNGKLAEAEQLKSRAESIRASVKASGGT
jgi:serine/threonine protein kinase